MRVRRRPGLVFLIDSGVSRGIEGSDDLGGALHITGSGDDQKAWSSARTATKRLR
jgi:hypothetical protein